MVRIYTDGACSGNPGPGGWAAILLFEEDQQSISGGETHATNNQMELKAVVEALQLLKSLGYSKATVYSDSAYVVNAVQNEWMKKWYANGWKTILGEDVKNKDLWLRLKKVLTNDVKFVKIKGHSGDKNNEKADALARKEVLKLK
jgi:ribonuclease HI